MTNWKLCEACDSEYDFDMWDDCTHCGHVPKQEDAVSDFTKGPWDFTGPKRRLTLNLIEGIPTKKTFYCVDGRKGHRMAFDVAFVEEEANARLIAQSPTLYDIAAGVIELHDMHGFDAAEILAGIEELAEKAEAVVALVDKETA